MRHLLKVMGICFITLIFASGLAWAEGSKAKTGTDLKPQVDCKKIFGASESEILAALQGALDSSGFVKKSGKKFYIKRIVISTDKMQSRDVICACCANGTYACCHSPCDPCDQ